MYVLGVDERYSVASPTFDRLGIDVDAWPVPPAGLFIVEERTVYLRSTSPVTIVHEFGHALDCALGNGVYRSGYDPRIRKAFHSARAFVTPYGAVSPDEYVAESVRAFVNCPNEKGCPWPDVSREWLLAIDPTMHDLLESLFQECSEALQR